MIKGFPEDFKAKISMKETGNRIKMKFILVIIC